MHSPAARLAVMESENTIHNFTQAISQPQSHFHPQPPFVCNTVALGYCFQMRYMEKWDMIKDSERGFSQVRPCLANLVE